MNSIISPSKKIIEDLANLMRILQTTTFAPEEAVKIALSLKDLISLIPENDFLNLIYLL